MATVKPKFRPSTVDGKEGTLFYRIIHNRRSHRIRTGYKLFPSEWDERSGGILIPPGSDEGRKNYLAVLQDRVAGDTDRLNLRYDPAQLHPFPKRTGHAFRGDRLGDHGRV